MLLFRRLKQMANLPDGTPEDVYAWAEELHSRYAPLLYRAELYA